jgi:hypothetical protein
MDLEMSPSDIRSSGTCVLFTLTRSVREEQVRDFHNPGARRLPHFSSAAAPFAGTWKLKLEKSKYKTGSPPKEQTARSRRPAATSM